MLPAHVTPDLARALADAATGSDDAAPLAVDATDPRTDVTSGPTRSRRRFLQGAAGGAAALVVGLHLPLPARAQSGATSAMPGGDGGGDFAPNAFVRIADDDTVTVLVKHIEFGQGPYTGLATLVAEELDADWSQMRAESAPSNTELYVNTLFGVQGTGGSTSIANSYEQMRKAGAAVRSMLVAAAAAEWQVDAADIDVVDGRITHPSGEESGFGAMARLAAGGAVPAEPSLKDPKDFRLIGRTLPKLDTRAKTTGRAMYSLDVYREGMLTVVVRHPPRFGAAVASVDEAAAREIEGVVDVKTIPQGVAVYAANTWAALKGRDALSVEWDDTNAETRSSEAILDTLRDAVATGPGTVVESKGDVNAAPADGARRLEATMSFPYLAHAPMETLDGVIEIRDDAVEVWMGSQIQTGDHMTLAGTLERPPEQIVLHTMLGGGSFGRRATPDAHFAAELATVARARGGSEPLKLLWTREDDIRGGYYRPVAVHRMSGVVDADGRITHWSDTVAAQSILEGTPMAGMMENGVDPMSVEGSKGLPYAFPNSEVSLPTLPAKVPVLWWRSVGSTHTGYATETFLDELLEAGGKDGLDGRMALLDPDSRDAGALRAVGELVDEKAGALPDGRARGVALHKSFGSYVAQVAEVSRGPDGLPKVHTVWCAVDCGIAINPDIIRAQVEGSIGYGLGAALYSEITLGEGGTIVESNFHDYPSLRIPEMPAVEVAIVDSGEAPTGIGEPGLPPLAPAVANAWRRLTGETLHRLPFRTVLS